MRRGPRSARPLPQQLCNGYARVISKEFPGWMTAGGGLEFNSDREAIKIESSSCRLAGLEKCGETGQPLERTFTSEQHQYVEKARAVGAACHRHARRVDQ